MLPVGSLLQDGVYAVARVTGLIFFFFFLLVPLEATAAGRWSAVVA